MACEMTGEDELCLLETAVGGVFICETLRICCC